MMAFNFRQIAPGTRCQNKAYIILLGLSGAGKTTTLNFLFDGEELTKTESYASATSQILEYTVNVPTQMFGDCELRVVDTPGFGDTRQKPLERDAQFMATFEKYLKDHSDLKSCYPTTVLLVVKYNDDRIDGETSHFIQMLKAIDNLLARNKLIDKGSKTTKSCNLIVVLTHTMSEENNKLRADPSAKIRLIESLVQTFTSIPIPIQVIMAENKPQLHKLEKLNGYHKLPNGQYYPLNLFQKIQSISVKSDDAVGEMIVREAFKNPKGLSKKKLLEEINLLPIDDFNVQEVYSKLNDARFHIEATDISRRLRELWEGLDDKYTKPYFNTLPITQQTFDKHKIHTLKDIPTTQKETLKLLSELPLNPPLVEILEKIGLVPPDLPNKTLGVGCVYNFNANDISLTKSPFIMQEQSYECTEIGFRAPNCVRAKTIAESVTLKEVHLGLAQYRQERLKELNVAGEISPEQIDSDLMPGHNIIGKDPNQVQKLSGVREYRLYQVRLIKRPHRKVNFKTAIHDLPPFSASEQQSKSKWQKFFTEFGTHVVKSALAGGYAEITAERKQGANRVTSPDKVLELITGLLANIGGKFPPNLHNLPDDWNFSIHFVGGDPNLVNPKLNMLYQDSGAQRYKQWVESLNTHPALLQSTIKLENVMLHVQTLSRKVAVDMSSAMRGLAGVTGFSETPAAPPKREETLPPMRPPWYHKLKFFFNNNNNNDDH